MIAPAAGDAVARTRQVRASLAQAIPDDIARLSRLRWRPRVVELTVFTALAAGGMTLAGAGYVDGAAMTTAMGIGVAAVGLNALVLLMHEGMHGLLFANRLANRLVSVLLGSTFLMSFSAYRVMHIRHHEYLGDPRDPDDYRNYTSRRRLVWCLHFVRLTLGPLLYIALIPLFALRYGSPAERRRIAGEYLVLAAIYTVVVRFADVSLLLVAWIAPLVLVGAMTAIRGFAQHGITDAGDPYLASRTLMPHPIVAFALLHENYHLEHHLFPQVPSYHLPRLHALVWPRLPRAVCGTGYLRFLVEFLRATPRMEEAPIGLVRPADGSRGTVG